MKMKLKLCLNILSLLTQLLCNFAVSGENTKIGIYLKPSLNNLADMLNKMNEECLLSQIYFTKTLQIEA